MEQLWDIYKDNQLLVNLIGLLSALLYVCAALLNRKRTIVYQHEGNSGPTARKPPKRGLATFIGSIAKAAVVALVGLACVVVFLESHRSGGTFTPTGSPATVVIFPGQMQRGILSASDSIGPNGAFVDRYALDVTVGATYVITMRSGDFPAAPLLENGNGQIVNALVHVPTTGVVQLSITAPFNERLYILATAGAPSVAGRYELEVVELR